MKWICVMVLALFLVVFTKGNTVGYEYGDYGDWMPCSRSCGGGIKMRARVCVRGPCPPEDRVETKPCNLGECRIAGTVICTDCVMMLGDCAKVCRTNMQRPCAAGPNRKCWFPRTQVVACSRSDCTTDEWGPYEDWQTCEADCQQKRYRQCRGDLCQGDDHESRSCFGEQCPTEYGDWGEWEGDCDSTCYQTRRRPCYKGDCSRQEERRDCTDGPCTQGPRWEEEAVSECDVNCTRRWRLECVAGPCLGQVRIETRPCDQDQCQQAVWGEWEQVEACNADCQSRWRRLCVAGACPDPPEQVEPRPCQNGQGACVDPWFPWTAWTDCLPACGALRTQMRRRQCRNANNEGCVEPRLERRRCDPVLCP